MSALPNLVFTGTSPPCCVFSVFFFSGFLDGEDNQKLPSTVQRRESEKVNILLQGSTKPGS